jgi:hypothetical protein
MNSLGRKFSMSEHAKGLHQTGERFCAYGHNLVSITPLCLIYAPQSQKVLTVIGAQTTLLAIQLPSNPANAAMFVYSEAEFFFRLFTKIDPELHGL